MNTSTETYPSPVLVALSRLWANNAAVTESRLRRYVDTGILPPPTVKAPRSDLAARYSWDALLTLRVVLAVRARGLPLQRYRKGLKLLRERWPEHSSGPVVSLLTDGADLVFFDGDLDAPEAKARAWELVSKSGVATGQGVATPVLVTLNLAQIRVELAEELARYDARRAEIPERARRNATALAAARKAARKAATAA